MAEKPPPLTSFDFARVLRQLTPQLAAGIQSPIQLAGYLHSKGLITDVTKEIVTNRPMSSSEKSVLLLNDVGIALLESKDPKSKMLILCDALRDEQAVIKIVADMRRRTIG